MGTPTFCSPSNADFKVTFPTAGAAGLGEAAQFRSLRSCKRQKGTLGILTPNADQFSIQFALES